MLLRFRFPCCAAIIEPNTDSAHPPLIGINIALFQKLCSKMADKIRKALQIKGTYQILFGFSLTIKKQPRAIIPSLMRWLSNPVSLRGVQIESVITKTIRAAKNIATANPQLGAFPNQDLVCVASIGFSFISVPFDFVIINQIIS
jgi:hypothetical protein